MSESNPIGDNIEAAMSRLDKIGSEALALRQRMELWASNQPQTIICSKHVNKILKIDMDRSSIASRIKSATEGKDSFVVIYQRCPECAIEYKTAREGHWLTAIGVPTLLLHGSFKTFRIEGDEDRENVAAAKAFADRRRGFLMMIGNVGDGKSLLAVAVLREFLAGYYTTHNNLLLDLRRGYGDRKAKDVIAKCQRAGCLVIDDFGLSMGGKDEVPMLQSILDHRYGEKLPVVITSNLTLEEIYGVMGERLADRMKESTYRVLRFNGPSSRTTERQKYFA